MRWKGVLHGPALEAQLLKAAPFSLWLQCCTYSNLPSAELALQQEKTKIGQVGEDPCLILHESIKSKPLTPISLAVLLHLLQRHF